MMQPFLLAALAVAAVVVTIQSWRHCQRGEFYSDTHAWGWLGIYVWGDGLVLGPFWILMAIWFSVATTRLTLLSILFFFIARSAYEVVYWLVHQTTQREYKPPLTRRFKWLDPNGAAIVYQVFHTCVVVAGSIAVAWLLGVR